MGTPFKKPSKKVLLSKRLASPSAEPLIAWHPKAVAAQERPCFPCVSVETLHDDYDDGLAFSERLGEHRMRESSPDLSLN